MLEHYHQHLVSGFWFESAYRRLLDELSETVPSTWVEVGVYHGASLAWLGVDVANRGKPVTIHAVDSFAGWQGVAQGDALRRSFLTNMAPVREALGDRVVIHDMTSVRAAQDFADASCDVVWIDADHSYEGVRSDIAAWWPKVKDGGVLGGDDWAFGGVRRAVLEAFPYEHEVGQGCQDGKPWPWWMVRKPLTC